jgi:hypothetical protein
MATSDELRRFQEQLSESARQAAALAPDRSDDTAAQLIRGLEYLAQHAAEMEDRTAALEARVTELQARVGRAGEPPVATPSI